MQVGLIVLYSVKLSVCCIIILVQDELEVPGRIRSGGMSSLGLNEKQIIIIGTCCGGGTVLIFLLGRGGKLKMQKQKL